MSVPIVGMRPPYPREVLFALELIDAVTLERVSKGVRPVADGLRGKPIVNTGGLFVWLHEDLSALRQIRFETEGLPLRADAVAAADLARPLMIVQLAPEAGYPFGAGTTAWRSQLIEAQDDKRLPVPGAGVWLAWLDDDGLTWHDAPTLSRTGPRGAFAVLLRLAPSDLPRFDASGALTVRLFARLDGEPTARATPAFQLPQGRVTDAPALAWNDLQP